MDSIILELEEAFIFYRSLPAVRCNSQNCLVDNLKNFHFHRG